MKRIVVNKKNKNPYFHEGIFMDEKFKCLVTSGLSY